jgi:hypothetical protein
VSEVQIPGTEIGLGSLFLDALGLTQLFVGKVMDVDRLWVAFFTPRLASIFLEAYQFFLFGINRNHGTLAV